MSTFPTGASRPANQPEQLSTGPRHPALDEFDRALAEYEALVDEDRARARRGDEDQGAAIPEHWTDGDEALTPPAGYWLGFVGRGDVFAMVGYWATHAEAVAHRATYGEDMRVYVTGAPFLVVADPEPVPARKPVRLPARFNTGADTGLVALLRHHGVAVEFEDVADADHCADCGAKLDALNRCQTVRPIPARGPGLWPVDVCQTHYREPKL